MFAGYCNANENILLLPLFRVVKSVLQKQWWASVQAIIPDLVQSQRLTF